MKNYQDINAETIDRWSENGWEWAKYITHEEFLQAKEGNYSIVLTPQKDIPTHWFNDLPGKKVLGLASGGGQQMPILTALGYECTVLDYSLKQLEAEKIVAEREGYAIEIIRADMTKPLPFDDNTFDAIIAPVSTCYIEELQPLFHECYRILKPHGVMMSGFDLFVNYITDINETDIKNTLPFNPLKNEEQRKELEQDDAGMQFSHTLTEQITGQLNAGFRLTDLYEDTNSAGNFHDKNIPAYIATRVVKD